MYLFFNAFEAYMAAVMIFTTAATHSFHRDMAENTKDCGMKTYCCMFGEICPDCRHRQSLW